MANNNHFELTLDTLAPVGGITRPTQYINAQTTLTIDKGDATFMDVWFDVNPSGTEPASHNWIAADTSIVSNFSVSGDYYYHLQLMDDLGNKSPVYDTQVITYDVVLPTVSSVSINDGAAITTTRNVSIEFEFSDNLSGCVSYAISGDVSETSSGALTAEEIDAGSATRSIVLSGTGEEDVTKTVSVTVTDASGNVSIAVSDSIILDTEFISGDIVVRDEADSKTLNNQWTNDQDIIVKLVLAHAGDLAGYKIWGDFNVDGGASATTEPAEFTAATPDSSGIVVIPDLKLTSGDSASKTFNAKVKDDAGNITTLTSVIVKADYSAPTVSIVCGESYVSLVSGFNQATFTPTVDASIAGAASFQWYLNGNEFAGGSGSGAPTALVVNASELGDGGAKVAKEFTLKVVDNAGNETTSAGVTLYLDTVAPAGEITVPAWMNGDNADHTTYQAFSSSGVTASATDGGAGLAYMTCWCDQNASSTTAPGTAIQVAYSANPTHGQIDWTGHGEVATNYIHIEYVDQVGNAAVAHSTAFGIDTAAPATGSITFDQFTLGNGAYNSVSAHAAITGSDSPSGLSMMKLTGDLTNGGNWEAFANAKAITLTSGDGTKTVYLALKDVAGNETAVQFVNDSCELDTTAPAASIALFEADGTTAKPAIDNLATMIAHISGSDDQGEPSDVGLTYKLYGDFTYDAQAAQGITEQEAEWETLTFDSGKQYMSIDNMFCTSGDGTKTIYVKVRDNAGNTTQASASFEYDTTAPEVVVSGVDYNRISKVHTLRRTVAEGEITGKYNDETNFTFTPNSAIQAYKVCAYEDQNAAEHGSAADTPIGTTGGSVNMSATGLNTDAAVNAMIRGADFEAALPESSEGKDGAHFVVVYVQDLAGTWSVAAEFQA